jgi:pyridoxine 4-dehydrogenase
LPLCCVALCTALHCAHRPRSQGKTPGQIAINWCLCKGTLPIPGVKNARQAQEVAGALGWRLTPEEVRALDAASDKVGTVAFGAPFEKW